MESSSLRTGKGNFDTSKHWDKYIGPKSIMHVSQIYVHRDSIWAVTTNIRSLLNKYKWSFYLFNQPTSHIIIQLYGLQPIKLPIFFWNIFSCTFITHIPYFILRKEWEAFMVSLLWFLHSLWRTGNWKAG